MAPFRILPSQAHVRLPRCVRCTPQPCALWMLIQEALRKGMESLSQAEVGSALQVYFNLGQLRQVSPPHNHSSMRPALCA